MLSSIEYGGASVPPATGMPCSRQYSISSSRPICQLRTGAMTFSSGASVATVASMPDLVVALAGAAVRDRVAAVLARVLDRELRDQRATERGEQRIAAAVEGVRLDRGKHVVLGELLAGVDDVAGRRRRDPSPCPRSRRSPPRLAQVDVSAYDLRAVLRPGSIEHHARCRGRRCRAAGRARPHRGRPRMSRAVAARSPWLRKPTGRETCADTHVLRRKFAGSDRQAAYASLASDPLGGTR